MDIPGRKVVGEAIRAGRFWQTAAPQKSQPARKQKGRPKIWPALSALASSNFCSHKN
jgi:hypothetical protein